MEVRMKKSAHRTRPPGAQRRPRKRVDRDHLDRLLDRALADSFPASDPVSTLIPEEPPASSTSGNRRPRR
jgi:hypothetical protein